MQGAIPTTHIFLGNAGGTGKTLFAALLADYFQLKGHNVLCRNADLLSPSLEEYQGIKTAGLVWDHPAHPESLKAPLEAAAGFREQISIIDFGPGSFIDIAYHLNAMDSRVCTGWQIHLPLTRARLRDTNFAMRHLLNRNRPLQVVLWLNQFHGPLSLQEALDGLSLWPEDIQGSVSFGAGQWSLTPGDEQEFATHRALSVIISDALLDRGKRARFKDLQRRLTAFLDALYAEAPAVK